MANVTTNQGVTVYTVTSSTDSATRIPDNLVLDPLKGVIHGNIPYQPAYVKNYELTVNATKYITTSSGAPLYVVTTTNTFTLAIKGEVESTIEWVTGTDLGSIETGITSELAVAARQINSDYTIKYQLASGTLPPGLALERDGSLSGRVNTGSTTGTYTFSVTASDVYQLSAVQRTFTVTVIQLDNRVYTEVYMRPFLSRQKRDVYREFISNEFTFPPNMMYRYFDANFGVRHDLRITLEFGIEKINLRDYVPALRENFYRRRFYFGDVKTAVAKDAHGKVLYELVYVDVADSLVNNSGDSVSSMITYNHGGMYYPGSVANMRQRLQGLVLPDDQYIGINYFNLPRFMQTPQVGSYRPVEYISVIPLCYALPGQASKIVSRIRLSKFDFKLIDFEVDRLIVQSSADNNSAKYLMFDREDLANSISDDYIVYGADAVSISTVQDAVPLTREE
jgi:hypothetical protein